MRAKYLRKLKQTIYQTLITILTLGLVGSFH